MRLDPRQGRTTSGREAARVREREGGVQQRARQDRRTEVTEPEPGRGSAKGRPSRRVERVDQAQGEDPDGCRRREDLRRDTDLSGADAREEHDENRAPDRSLSGPHHQVHGEGHRRRQRQIEVADRELVELQRREGEQEPRQDRGRPSSGDPMDEEAGRPRGGDRREHRKRVERRQRAERMRDGGEKDARRRHARGPREVRAAGREQGVRVRHQVAVCDRAGPPSERPQQDRAVGGIAGHDPSGVNREKLRQEHGAEEPGVDRQGAELFRGRPHGGRLVSWAG